MDGFLIRVAFPKRDGELLAQAVGVVVGSRTEAEQWVKDRWPNVESVEWNPIKLAHGTFALVETRLSQGSR